MTINKVIFGGETLVDLTNDTVSTDTLAKGVTAHDKTGVQITGTMEFGGHQIFEIFQSLRKDETDIDGAYPCDGREFSKSDFSGGNNPYDMLVLNKARTLTYDEWNTEVTAKGVCFSFALDEENEKFKIPKLINDTIPTLTGTVGDVGKSDVANTGSGRNIGETVFSLIPLTDAGLHLLDGSLLNVGGIYDEAITKIAALKSSNPNLFITEENWQLSVTNYGVCGKFVYTEGVSLRIPKITGFVEGTLDATALGSLVEAGLPNLVGSSDTVGFSDTRFEPTGCFYPAEEWSVGTFNIVEKTGTAGANVVRFDASHGNPTYGKSTTVQPQAIKGYLYIVVATATKTDIEVDIDNVATSLNGKAGTDLSNISTVGKVAVAHLGMPSGNYVGLSIPVSNTDFTATADGYFFSTIFAPGASNGFMNFINRTTGFGVMSNVPASSAVKHFMPVRKGDVVRVEYNNLSEETTFGFFYAEGSQP